MAWEKCLISVPIFNERYKTSRGLILIDAEVNGVWAVHKTIDRFVAMGPYMHQECFTLTHRPTGCVAVQAATRAKAKAFYEKIKALPWHLVKRCHARPPAGFDAQYFFETRRKYQAELK